MITKESFQQVQKSLPKIVRRRSKLIEKIFAVFEIENFNLFLMITEGMCHNAENYQVFKINCLEKPYLTCFDQETSENFQKFECSRILIDSIDFHQKVQRDLEFLARVGRAGFTLVVFKLVVDSLNSSDVTCKVEKGQVMFKVVDVFQECLKSSWISNFVGKRKRNVKRYKEKVLKRFRSFVKNN
jgi:hypothetical protein